ncbi:hypothetical protein QQS21_007682 [Conoideocrella luteorostrata]|uniref:Macro domain-containing protein n=1 Tax=Conoideocrella luteorostrata TaxID=1105319 RepID=A0AAJ0FS61_9HYPO|nr:hypothetical protein QQS21_007682 [Conoideocrella luteorostrata]
MSVKTLSDIPTITQLYQSSALRRAVSSSSSSFLPSASINSRVGLIRGDITKLELDAIVNAANSSLLGGGGVDGAIHRAAGPSLKFECSEFGGCSTGDAVITGGYELPAKHVIHTVGPVFSNSNPQRSEESLRSCYEKSLNLAASKGIKTIAFSGISTGVYGYPSMGAAEVACETVRRFLGSDGGALEKVIFVTFEQKDVAAYNDVLP